MNKRMIAIILIILAVIVAMTIIKSGASTKTQHPDCETVKETCNRKKGCKCKPNCDHEGRRLPPAGGKAECPSYCCEKKCECHPAGCP